MSTRASEAVLAYKYNSWQEQSEWVAQKSQNYLKRPPTGVTEMTPASISASQQLNSSIHIQQ